MSKAMMILAGALLLAGCGHDSKSSSSVEKISMVQGEAVSVYPGDSIAPGNDETRIAIRHEVGQEVKSVTLLAGSAELLRGEYAIGE